MAMKQVKVFLGSWSNAKPILEWLEKDWPQDVSKPRYSDMPAREPMLHLSTRQGIVDVLPGESISKDIHGTFYVRGVSLKLHPKYELAE